MERGTTPMLDPSFKSHLSPVAFENLSMWCENMCVSVYPRHWFDEGHTKASLALVALGGRGGARGGVLKHCPGRAGQLQKEFLGFSAAAESGPVGFAEAHLVGLDAIINQPIPDGEGGLFLVMRYKGGGSRRYVTMAPLLDTETLGSACQAIIPEVLQTWNEQDQLPERTPGGMTAQDFLREVLRHHWEEGGPVRKALDEIESTISGPGIENIRLSGLRGNAHGDLHLDNIIIPIPVNSKPTKADFKDFILIDLSTYRKDRLLAVDPAHLVLSIIARQLPSIVGRPRDDLAKLVLDPGGAATGWTPGPIAAVVKKVHQAAVDFTESRDLYDEWSPDSLAATAACALLFVGRKGIAEDERQWFLQVATRAIGQLENQPPGRDSPGRDRGTTASVPPPSQPRDGPGEVIHLNLPVAEDRMAACITRAEELAREISALVIEDVSSATDATTATTYARAQAESLANALDEARRWYEVQRPDLHLAYTNEIGMAEALLAGLRQELDDAVRQGLDRIALDGLVRAAVALSLDIANIRRQVGPGTSPDP